MHTSRRLKIAPKGTIHASGSKNEQLLKNSELRNPAHFNTRLLGHFDHGLQLNQDAFFSLDFGRGVRDPGASLLHIRLQLLAGGFAVALEIFVRCSFLLSLLGDFLCHLLQECHNSPDGIHLVPHLHGANFRQRQIGKGKKQKCRPSKHDSAVSTFHCFVCSDKKPEPEVAQRTEQRVAQQGPQTLTAHSSHHCPRLRENATNTDRTQFSPLSSTPRKYHEKQQKKTIWFPQIIKKLAKHGKNDKFMIKISKNTTKTRQKRQFDVQTWPTEGPMFQNSSHKQEIRNSSK